MLESAVGSAPGRANEGPGGRGAQVYQDVLIQIDAFDVPWILQPHG